MNSRIIRETLTSEEKVENENNNEENDGVVGYLKSYGKYFIGVWKEISKSQSKNSSVKLQDLGLKVAHLLAFINDYSIVI